jgi:ubiquinone/menaquinone biosynthesis C-methylase UbiE
MMEAEPILRKIGLKSGECFFDAGCGDGFFTIPAAKMVGSAGKIFAVDVWEEGIQGLNNKLHSSGITNVFTSIADLTLAVPIDDDGVDVCLLSNILHGFVANNEIEAVFSEIRRVLKAGGRLAVIEFKKMESHGPPIEIRLTPFDVDRIISPFGFQKAMVSDVGPLHYLITFIRSE